MNDDARNVHDVGNALLMFAISHHKPIVKYAIRARDGNSPYLGFLGEIDHCDDEACKERVEKARWMWASCCWLAGIENQDGGARFYG